MDILQIGTTDLLVQKDSKFCFQGIFQYCFNLTLVYLLLHAKSENLYSNPFVIKRKMNKFFNFNSCERLHFVLFGLKIRRQGRRHRPPHQNRGGWRSL